MALLTASACASGPRPVDFNDALSGPVSPALSIPFEKYALTADGLLRTNSESGIENGIERPVIRTVSGEYLSREFVFEVDVTIPADHGDIAYVGFGSGNNNPLLDNEPSQAILFRIHNLPRMPFYGIDAAVGDPAGGMGYRGAYREFQRIGEYTPGNTMRFQIAHRAGHINGVLALVIIALAVVVWRQTHPAALTIAIQQFEIEDPPPGQENFPDGLRACLRAKMAIAGIETAEPNQAGAMLSGQLRPRNGGFEVTIQLTRIKDGERIWDWIFDIPADADMPPSGQNDARSRLQGAIATRAAEGLASYLNLSGSAPVTR